MERHKKPESENFSEEFTKSGKCLDEITFIFDDGKKLYVSQNFLHYASPVFQAMFKQDWKEKETKTVKLPGKKYEDFLEFLLCLHPNKQNPVDKKNVLRLCTIADEYQSALIIKKCKEVMLKWLSKEVTNYSSSDMDVKATATRSCLQILIAVVSLTYEEVFKKAVSSVACCGYQWFTGTIITSSFLNEETKEITMECKALYQSLSDTLKVRVLSERLNKLDQLI